MTVYTLSNEAKIYLRSDTMKLVHSWFTVSQKHIYVKKISRYYLDINIAKTNVQILFLWKSNNRYSNKDKTHRD